MKFIHTADLHIDQPFSGVTSDDASFKKTLKGVNNQVLTNIVDTCIEQSVDFLLIVGDTFHQAKSSIYVQQFVMGEFKRLGEHGIKVILSFGNHDYYTKNRYWFDWPDNVVLFDNEQVTTKLLSFPSGESVAISGFSYEHQWITKGKANEYPERHPDTDYHVGFYHGENATSGHYAPFQASQLRQSYDYWALGHIHKSEELVQNPLTIYPGTPQGHTRKDKDTKGVSLVEMTRYGTTHQWLSVNEVNWINSMIVLDGQEQRAEYLDKIVSHVLEQRTYSSKVDLVVVTVKPVTEQLMSDLIESKEEIKSYLQNYLLEKTDHSTWLVDIVVDTVESHKLIMGFDVGLIDDLSNKYQDEEAFKEISKDVLQQAVIAANIHFDEEDVHRIIKESTQLVKDKMIFKNGVSE